MNIKEENDFSERDRKVCYDAAMKSDKLIFNFLDINRTMRSLYEGRGSQKHILIVLLEAGSITQRKLTERLGIQPGSASEVLSKLEKSGLIARAESSTDRRTTDITLTKQGRTLAQEAATQRRMRHEEMFSCLTEEEKGTLLVLLEKVNADWRERYRGIGGHSRGRRDHRQGMTEEGSEGNPPRGPHGHGGRRYYHEGEGR